MDTESQWWERDLSPPRHGEERLLPPQPRLVSFFALCPKNVCPPENAGSRGSCLKTEAWLVGLGLLWRPVARGYFLY